MAHSREFLLQALEDEMLAHHLPFAKLPSSKIYPEQDCLCYESKINFGAFGGVLAQRFTASNVDQRIESLNKIIEETGKDLGWVMSPVATPSDLADRLAAAGGRQLVELTGMVLDCVKLAKPPEPKGLEIKLVEDVTTLEQYARIYPLLYHVPIEGWIDDLVELEREIFITQATPWNRWVAYEGGRPVAAARTAQQGGIGALQILCTLRERRNRGIGQALATHGLRHEACNTAIVWAGPDADRLYSRMGFREVCKASVYVFERQN